MSARAATRAPAPTRRGLLTAEPGYHAMTRAFQREILAQALLDSGGNVTHAATALGLSRTYLHRLMRQFKLGGFRPFSGIRL